MQIYIYFVSFLAAISGGAGYTPKSMARGEVSVCICGEVYITCLRSFCTVAQLTRYVPFTGCPPPGKPWKAWSCQGNWQFRKSRWKDLIWCPCSESEKLGRVDYVNDNNN